MVLSLGHTTQKRLGKCVCVCVCVGVRMCESLCVYVPSGRSGKAVQKVGRTISLDFPSPPPAITDGSEFTEHGADDYLSLKARKHTQTYTHTHTHTHTLLHCQTH